jgi:hypothetical protein
MNMELANHVISLIITQNWICFTKPFLGTKNAVLRTRKLALFFQLAQGKCGILKSIGFGDESISTIIICHIISYIISQSFSPSKKLALFFQTIEAAETVDLIW